MESGRDKVLTRAGEGDRALKTPDKIKDIRAGGRDCVAVPNVSLV